MTKWGWTYASQLELRVRRNEVASWTKSREGWLLVPRGSGSQSMQFNNPALIKNEKKKYDKAQRKSTSP
jgi:hypothetical protein